jgi:hypothetical protein
MLQAAPRRRVIVERILNVEGILNVERILNVDDYSTLDLSEYNC